MCGRTSQRVLWYTTGRANTYVDDDTRNDPARTCQPGCIDPKVGKQCVSWTCTVPHETSEPLLYKHRLRSVLNPEHLTILLGIAATSLRRLFLLYVERYVGSHHLCSRGTSVSSPRNSGTGELTVE